MSGLNRTPGKRVQGNTLTGVRIPLSPPKPLKNGRFGRFLFPLSYLPLPQFTLIFCQSV